MKKVSTKRYRAHKFLDYLGVAFLCLLMLFIWQLYKGPIAVPYLKPYIIKALNSDDSTYQVSLDSVNIELVRSIQPIKIIANNIVYKKNDDSFIVNAPRTSVSFSIKALLHGIVAPSSIEVDSPRIYAFMNYGIAADNKNDINKKKLEYYVDVVESFMERFNSDDEYYAESYINSINVKNAEVEIHEVDLGRKWAMSDVNYGFNRNFTNITTDFNALLKIKDKVSSIGLEAEFKDFNDILSLKTYFTDVVPADLIGSFLDEEINKKLYQINLPVSGNIETVIDFEEVMKHRDNIVASLDTAVKKINFKFEGGQGDIMFNADESMRYDVSSFLLGGEIVGGIDKVKIENAAFDLGGQKMLLSLYASGVKNYLLENSLKNIELSIVADINDLKFDDLGKYWPRYIAENAWNWCKTSLFVGSAQNAHFQFDFGYDPTKDAVVFKNLAGKTDIADAEVNYLAEMPNIKNIYGQATFSNDSIKVNLDKGVSEGVILTGGYLDLYDLNKAINFANIKLIMESSVTDALRLIDNPPLYFVRDMKIPADKLSGYAVTDLLLNFELKGDLLPDEVHAEVKAKLSDVKMDKVVNGQSLSASKLDLDVTNQSLLLHGDAVLDDVPLKITWKEAFKNKKDKTRYEVSLKLDDAVKKKLGLDVSVLSAPYVEGYANVNAIILVSDDNKMKIDVKANLQHANIDYSFLGFKKLDGADGYITAELNFANDKLVSIPMFNLYKPDFNLKGKINLDSKGEIKVIDIYNISGPKTNAKAKIEMLTAKGKPFVKINVSGSSYDLTEFFEKNESLDKEQVGKAPEVIDEEEDDELEKVTNSDIFIAVNSLWTNPYVPISNFAGSVQLRNGIGVYELHLIGNYGNSKQVRLKADYIPKPNKEFLLSIDSNNAGSTLKVLRIYDNMRGGNLRIEAKRNIDKQFVGHASIRDFSIHNTPVVAKLLTVASLTGMVNMLTGEGIAFSHFDAPFEYEDKIITVKEGKAFGNVLGITMNGSYNRLTEVVNGKGVIAPAYSINSLIGRLPLVGGLLSGKDGTVFAANYSIIGGISDPKVSINPLSALSPSSVKDLFASLFGEKNDGR